MRKSILVVALVLLLASAAVVQATPKLTIPDGTFDFGYVPQNSEISHVFWLHSTGDDSLQILRVVPG